MTKLFTLFLAMLLSVACYGRKRLRVYTLHNSKKQ